MATLNAIDLRYDTSRWIAREANFNAFVTLTLKQGLPSASLTGGIRSITRQDCIKTVWMFRDRLTQRLLGISRRRAGHLVPIAAFVEGDAVKRFHLHFLVERPEETGMRNFRTAVCHVTEKLDWVYDQIDTREITYGSPEWIANYCLKEGPDAFLPEASSLRSNC